jgi:uncharacterized protein YcfL
MNKLTLSALMASFLLISACGESTENTADADKSVMDSAVEMTEQAAESVSESTSDAYDATTEMANDVADSAMEMMEEDKPKD